MSYQVTSGAFQSGGSSAVLNTQTQLIEFDLTAGNTVFTLTFNPTIRTETRMNGAVAVFRGALTYVMDIARSQKILAQDSVSVREVESVVTVPY